MKNKFIEGFKFFIGFGTFMAILVTSICYIGSINPTIRTIHYYDNEKESTIEKELKKEDFDGKAYYCATAWPYGEFDNYICYTKNGKYDIKIAVNNKKEICIVDNYLYEGHDCLYKVFHFMKNKFDIVFGIEKWEASKQYERIYGHMY